MSRQRQQSQLRTPAQEQESAQSQEQAPDVQAATEVSPDVASSMQGAHGNAAAQQAIAARTVAPELEVEEEQEQEQGQEQAQGSGGQATAAPPVDDGEGGDDDGEAAAALDSALSAAGGGGGGADAPPAEAADSSGGGAGGGGGAPAGGGGAPGGGAPADAGGGGGAPASEKTVAAPVALEGSDAKGVIDNFASLGSSKQAVAFPDLGTTADTKTKEAEATFQEALPDFTVEMSGEESGETSTSVEPVAAASAAGQDSPQAAPEPVIEETQQLGSFQTGFSSSRALAGFGEGEEADTASNARAIGSSISSMPTTDGSISTSAGARPAVPLQGESDPQRVVDGASTAAAESSEGLANAHAAIAASPGAELVQPLALTETRGAENLAAIAVAPTAPVTDMAAFVELGLPEDVKGAFDELSAPEMNDSIADMQSQVDTATADRDAGRDAALSDANAEQDRLVEQAHTQQTAAVAEQRAAISAERQSTMAQQATAVADIQGEIDIERQSQMTGIDSRVTAERSRIDAEFSKGERDAASEVAKGEQDAERERRESERESENRSWWDRACDFVADALASLADAIGSIFDAVRNAVSAIIDAVKDFAESVIAAAVQWINEQIAAFGAWLNEKIQGLLGDIFPELADALCAFVDGAVKLAQDAVSAIGDAMLAGLTALLDAFEGALNAVLNVMQAAMSAALAMATALITGDWMAFLMMAIEAALQLAGISPDQFYSFIGRAEDTIQAILDDPGGFISNVIDAVAQGFGQFADNFLTHLQTGFVEWLTGQAGDAGITMPSELNLAGIFDIVLQVMGLTPERIREKAAEYIGEENVAMIEHVWGFVDAAITNGLAGLWEHVQGYMSGLWDMVIGAIQDWLMERIIMAAVTRLATMFNPVGAIVNALITAWNLYTFLTEQISRIWGVVTAVVDTIGDIVAGNLSGAANMVEGALADLVPVAISLLANLLGLGGIGEKVREVIEGIQETVWNAIDSVVESVKGMFSGGSSASDSDSEEETSEGGGEYDGQIGEEKTFAAEDESHRLWIVDNGGGNTTVMIASTPMSIDDRVANWNGRLTDVPNEQDGVGGPQDRPLAETQLGTVRTQAETVKTAAREAASAGSDEERAAADTRTEQAQGVLAPTLQALFNNFKDTNPASLEERAQLEGGLALQKYNEIHAEASPGAAGLVPAFETAVLGRLNGGQATSVLQAMRDEVSQNQGTYTGKGTAVPAADVQAQGGVSRVVDLPSVFNYYLPQGIKDDYAGDADAFAAEVNRGEMDPRNELTGSIRGQYAQSWWFARQSAPSMTLSELIDDLAVNESPQYEKGVIRLDFNASEAMGGAALTKPTAFDGMPFGQFVTAPGNVWGVTAGGAVEAVAPELPIASARTRTLVLGSLTTPSTSASLKEKFAQGLGTVDRHARPEIEDALERHPTELRAADNWTAARAVLEADSAIAAAREAPLSGAGGFATGNVPDTAVPAAELAWGAADTDAATIGMSAAEWVNNRKGQVTSGNGLYGSAKSALQEQFFASASRSGSVSALQGAYEESLSGNDVDARLTRAEVQEVLDYVAGLGGLPAGMQSAPAQATGDWVAVFATGGRALTSAVAPDEPMRLNQIWDGDLTSPISDVAAAIQVTIESDAEFLRYCRRGGGSPASIALQAATDAVNHLASRPLHLVRGTDIPRKVTRGGHVRVRDGVAVAPALYGSVASSSSDILKSWLSGELHHVLPLYLGGGHEAENLTPAEGHAGDHDTNDVGDRIATSAHAALHDLIDGTEVMLEIDDRIEATTLDWSDLATSVGEDALRVLIGTLSSSGAISYQETSLSLNPPSSGSST